MDLPFYAPPGLGSRRTQTKTHIARIMRLTAIFLFAAGLSASATGSAQRLTLSEKDAPIGKVFKDIRQQTGYEFLYTDEMLTGTVPVTFDLKDADLQAALAACFKGQPLAFTINEKTVVVKPKPAAPIEINQLTPPSNNDIHGRVTDSLGNPLVGASVTVKGGRRGTQTDEKGEFVLKGIGDDATIVISFSGFASRTLKFGDLKGVNVVLSRSNSQLDQVQVIAYGTTTERLSVGNVTSIKGDDIAKQPVSNPLLALEGNVPGLFITQSSGLSGTGVTARVQGQNSINNGSDPFYVVDGVPYLSQLPSTGVDAAILGTGSSGGLLNGGSYGAGSPFSYINPSDIESIEVLKDADATAIYGSRAANGAILITTKKGKIGQTKFDFDVHQGAGRVTRELKMLNTAQYLEMRHEAFNNDGLTPGATDYDLTQWDTTRYTNWQKALIGNTSQYSNINGSVSGGNSSVQYLISGTWHRETTVFPGDFSDQKGSMHFTITSASANQKLHILFSGNYLIDDNRLPNNDLTQWAILTEPDAPPLRNPDGTLNWAVNGAGVSSLNNPLQFLSNIYKNKTTNLISNAVISYEIFPKLTLRSSFGYTNTQTNDFNGTPLVSINPTYLQYGFQRTALYGDRNLNSWIIEPQANYKRNVGKGKLDVLIGSTFLQNNTSVSSIEGQGYNSDRVLENITSASSIFPVVSTISVYKYSAVFGRINYNWSDKYIVDVTTRRDGSSRFGSQNQFHDFASVGAAWIFSQEEMLRVVPSFLSFGKLRGSYGTTGNDQIGDYTYLNLYSPINSSVPYQGLNGLGPNSLPNPYLQWEETRKLQLGIDLGFLKDRILINTTYVRNRSSNQLLGYLLPATTGFSGITENFPATIQNKSLELAINTINIKRRRFTWSSSFNFTIPRNKVIAFPNISSTPYAYPYNGVVIGQPLGVKPVYRFLGVDPGTGLYEFSDGKGGKTFGPDTAQTVTQNEFISTLPKLYGGFSNSVSYQGFQLDILFQFVKQVGPNVLFFNSNQFPGVFAPGYSNQPVTVLNRWEKTGDIAAVHKFSTQSDQNSYDAIGSDYYYSDASYIRLKNLALSYQLPNAWIRKAHMLSCRVYVQGQNLLTLTHYKGMDPENQSTTSLPPLRVITGGINIGL
jgi:TonB-dependent starch-binding outer membrane protein SusC